MCISRNTTRSNLSEIPETTNLLFKAAMNSQLYQGIEQAQHASQPEYTTPHQQHAHHVVQHNYHDHINDVDLGMPDPVAKGGVTTPFPIKLHQMLDKIEEDGFAHVVSWQPHGRCFVVHKPKAFVDHIMPTYFKQSKLASFQRQLNLYGFQRLTRGLDKGGYYHEMFLRGKVFLAHKIHRMRVKGTGVRARSNPDSEPNFYAMAPVIPDSAASSLQSMLITPSLPTEQTPQPSSELREESFDDFVLDFEGKKFHELDLCDIEEREVNAMKIKEHNLPESLNISQDLLDDILLSMEDDKVYGDLLLRLIES